MNTIAQDRAGARLRSFGKLTIFAVFVLIFIGGLVRGTGSGMGCPDWPKCFGLWVPPTDASQLPANYKEVYKDHGYGNTDFNAMKTWTEYLNRLSGVLVGFFIILTVVFSFPYLKRDPAIFWLNLLVFLLVGLEGWIGAKVVDTNLAHWMVTIHMLLSVVIVGLLIYTITRSQQFTIETTGGYDGLSSLKWLCLLALVLSAIQIVSGTQVREEVDLMARLGNNNERGTWLEQMGTVFSVHKLLSLLLVSLNVFLTRIIYRHFSNTLINRAATWLLITMGIQLLGGLLMVKLALPPVIQMFHLFVGSISTGVQLFIAIMVYTKTRQATAGV